MKTHNKISLAALGILFLLSGFVVLQNPGAFADSGPISVTAVPQPDENGFMAAAVGVTGGYIEKQLPCQYFVLGTGKATGTFAAMHDNIINRSNTLLGYSLEAPIANYWEQRFSLARHGVFYASTAVLNPTNDTLKHPHISYGPGSGENTYDFSTLHDLHDTFFFIRETHANSYFK